ncbi:PLP-dependent aminotransferase family protein [Leifsonia sp. fls2-241-R2A-40a]|uniref:MocR-like pyridoxine biosynthesis transcription factor PdxR n=1 Tax=Leifsonia sp. fls2-241-R2A-40a TaxID=3040290 RepID=UPI00254EC444|nr:PLP-dependent aminotransferase family protein [Leifsonia sp. fls2-241-R2A-40a]
MELHVAIDGRGDRAERIYRQLRDAIVDGRLRRGERLPATREFADQLQVSRTTVSTAYERLTAEGYLAARVGAGTFVAYTGASHAAAPSSRRGGAAQPTALWRDLDDPLWTEPRPVAFDFSIGSPDPMLFPLDTWRRYVTAELRGGFVRSAHYADPAGVERLREGIARHLGLARSVEAGPDDVLVTSGAQQAFDLIARVLLRPGDTVVVEDPGYPPVRQLFETTGARVVPVPVDEHGLRVDELPPARLVYLTPSHQFPLGGVLPLERRVALLEWAARHDAVVIEDDYDSEYRFGARALDPLQRLDADGRVVYVGTFSKTMAPALRLGFLVAPPALLPALRNAKRLTDWHNDVVTQRAMARFLDTGGFARHVRVATRAYEERHRVLTEAVGGMLPGLSLVPSAAGLHLALLADGTAATGFDGRRVAERAAVAGVSVQPVSRFRVRPGPDGLLLGFGGIPAEQIPDGLRILAEAVERERTSHPADPVP